MGTDDCLSGSMPAVKTSFLRGTELGDSGQGIKCLNCSQAYIK